MRVDSNLNFSKDLERYIQINSKTELNSALWLAKFLNGIVRGFYLVFLLFKKMSAIHRLFLLAIAGSITFSLIYRVEYYKNSPAFYIVMVIVLILAFWVYKKARVVINFVSHTIQKLIIYGFYLLILWPYHKIINRRRWLASNRKNESMLTTVNKTYTSQNFEEIW